MALSAADPARRCFCVALATLTAGCATRRRPSSLADDDEVLALRAAGIGLYELSAGRLAQARAQRTELQAFGRLLVDHHEVANASLLGLLRSHGVAPPRAMPAYLESRLAQLQPDGVAGFDRRFARIAGLQDQERLLALHDHAVLAVQDAALRDWFGSQLPVLRSHLAVARSLAAATAG